MGQCSFCGHRNRIGSYFCENCGGRLSKDQTETLYGGTINFSELHNTSATRGTSIFPVDAALILFVAGIPDPIVIQPLAQVVLGRDGGPDMPRPDIDLTPYDAHQKGVSRIHAAFERIGDRLLLFDLNSKNGVYLNGERIESQRPYVVHDEDEIRLNKLVLNVYFK